MIIHKFGKGNSVVIAYRHIKKMWNVLSFQNKFTNVNLSGDPVSPNFPINQEKRVEEIFKRFVFTNHQQLWEVEQVLQIAYVNTCTKYR